ncbi:MAG: hypothetical protein HWD92_04395 [Flavobacteriia bacterium]|nr:hypothetical protein [Flavobacteriia bacterium]
MTKCWLFILMCLGVIEAKSQGDASLFTQYENLISEAHAAYFSDYPHVELARLCDLDNSNSLVHSPFCITNLEGIELEQEEIRLILIHKASRGESERFMFILLSESINQHELQNGAWVSWKLDVLESLEFSVLDGMIVYGGHTHYEPK